MINTWKFIKIIETAVTLMTSLTLKKAVIVEIVETAVTVETTVTLESSQ